MFSSYSVIYFYSLFFLIINSNLVVSVREKLLALCAGDFQLKGVDEAFQFDWDEVIAK
jgi:hypothetical protein